MLSRLKTALVSSFIGAITLGWVFAQAVLRLAYVFATPVASWISRREYGGVATNRTIPTSFFFQDAIPDLIRGCALLIFGYALLRWLYYKPLEADHGGGVNTGL